MCTCLCWSLSLVQVVSSTCAAECASVLPGCGQMCWETNPLWLLVFLCSRCSWDRRPSSSYPADHSPKGPLPKGKTQVNCCPFSFWHQPYLALDVLHLLLGASRLSAGSVRSSGRFSTVPLHRWRHQCAAPGLHSFLGHISCQCQRAAPRLAASARSGVLLSDPHTGLKGNRTHAHASVVNYK